MKHLKSLLLVTAIFIGASSFLNAQDKVAHINLTEVITSMPEYKAAQAEVEKLGKTYDGEIQASLKELEAKFKQYGAEASSQTQQENEKRKIELSNMEQSIAEYRQQAQKDIQKLELDKLKPIREKAEAAVKKVAAALGFDYILDRSALVVATGKDITGDVKTELGI